MRNVAAYLLLHLAGQKNPKASDIEKVLSAAGVEADSANIESLLSELNGKSIEEVIAAGQEKMSSVPAAAPAAAGAAPAAKSGGAAKEEAKKEESESESDEEMGFGLFD